VSARDLIVIAAVTGGVIYAAISYSSLPSQPTVQTAAKPAALVNTGTPSAAEMLKTPGTLPNEAQRPPAGSRAAATESAPAEKRSRHRNREKTKHH
jgi:hypothetical protein